MTKDEAVGFVHRHTKAEQPLSCVENDDKSWYIWTTDGLRTVRRWVVESNLHPEDETITQEGENKNTTLIIKRPVVSGVDAWAKL